MAHEVTVVGTSGGATPEVIGDAGVVVPGDDPLALSAALRRLAAADQRRPLAQAGKAPAQRAFLGGGGGRRREGISAGAVSCTAIAAPTPPQLSRVPFLLPPAVSASQLTA